MNLAGSFAQTQVSADATAKTQNADRNKRARDAKELAKLADQHQHEVENTEEAEGLRVHREGEGDNAGQHLQDTYDQTDQNNDQENKLYHPQQKPKPKTPPPPMIHPPQATSTCPHNEPRPSGSGLLTVSSSLNQRLGDGRVHLPPHRRVARANLFVRG